MLLFFLVFFGLQIFVLFCCAAAGNDAASQELSDQEQLQCLFVKMAFQSAKKHPKECRSARVDIDRRITATIESWKKAAI